MKKIRIAIIGQGRSGYAIHAHLMGLMRDRYEVVAVSDRIEDRCADSVREFGCAAYADYRGLLARKDLDLVVNATPSHLHPSVTLEAFEAGHNVLCEKPMARTAAQADEMIAAAKEKGRFFAVYQQSRFAPYYRKVREIIDSGALGRIVLVKIAFNGFGRRWDWQTLQDHSGGNLLNTGPHPLDQALGLFGRDIMPAVFCRMDRAVTYGDAEDFVKVILYGRGRPTVDLEISSCDAYPLFTYHVEGTRGGLKGDMKHLDWKFYRDEDTAPQVLNPDPMPNRAYCMETLPWNEASWDVPEAQSNLFDYMGVSFYENLYEAFVNGKSLEVPPEQVRQQIAVIEECHRQNPLSRKQ